MGRHARPRFTADTPWAPFHEDAAIHVAAQTGDPDSVLATYRGLIATRRSSAALTDGAYRALATAERVLVMVNLDGQPHPAAVDLAGAGITAARVSDRIFGASSAYTSLTPANAAADRPELPAHTGRWLRLE